jgi:hypothetical protein
MLGGGVVVAKAQLSVEERARVMNPGPTPSEQWTANQKRDLTTCVDRVVVAWAKHIDLLNKGIRNLKTKREVHEAFEQLEKNEGW